MNNTLLMDIGNSTAVTAHYANGRIGQVTKVATNILETVLDQSHPEMFSKVIVSSVVPDMTIKLKDKFDGVGHFVDSTNIPSITLGLECTEQVGADRLVNALAAHHIYKKPCLIVDSGTALTFCLVTENGRYEGGLILPGMAISSKALHQETAQIPLIWVENVKGIVGRNTEEAVRMGLYQGYKVMINGLIQQYKERFPDVMVIGTGSGLEVLKDELDIDEWDSMLQLKGLAVCADSLVAN